MKCKTSIKTVNVKLFIVRYVPFLLYDITVLVIFKFNGLLDDDTTTMLGKD